MVENVTLSLILELEREIAVNAVCCISKQETDYTGKLKSLLLPCWDNWLVIILNVACNRFKFKCI